MKLYLAVAVLMLAFAAQAEAEEPSLEEHFTNFGTQMTAITKDVAEKAKTVFESINNSDFAVKTKSWFDEQIEAIKAKIGEIRN